ncbi:amino acid adenylation domain-containing protein [Pseudomonas putida]|uniref:non-ribosomal peptide synthetase n=1 Tax=Pseudomonas putida TaxID=303 RepID=UPI002D1EB463|nr:non-ribosomal peptide synthetase [Pseudomonas putida]MEB3899147.1 amino acid adenylation domain-containing protein [Pseudomonas putida]
MQKLIESVGALTAKERRALAVMLRHKGINLYAIAPMFRRGEDEPLLLSYAQQRQWFLWQLEPGAATYNIPLAVRMRGPLDRQALEHALAQVVARHESLRTVFVETAEGVRQQVLAPFAVALPVHAMAAFDGPEEAARTEAFLLAQSGQGFDLAHGPLLRAALLECGADDHVLSLVLHHIVADAWSLQVLLEELAACYAACVDGRDAGLPALAVQYPDYALWQRQWMDNGERERQLAYWRERLAGAEDILCLPTDRPRPALPSHAGASVDASPGPELAARLKALATQEGVTLFVLLLAAYQALLQRLCGQQDIRVGVPNANRGRAETERLVGFFVNTQVMRAQVRPEQPFSTLLAEVREAALQAQQHQDLPFEQLLEALQTERSLSHSALFQVMFNHQREDLGTAASASTGLQLQPLTQPVRSSKFDLTLNTLEHDEGLEATLIYACDLFDAASAERIAGQWRSVLQAICENPRVRIEDLPLLGPAQRHTLLAAGQGERCAFADRHVLALFRRQVAEHPRRLALVAGSQRLDFAELDVRSERLAALLQAQGVGPEVPVAVALGRGASLPLAILAIFKAGAGYVPIDPQAGGQRLQDVLENSGARLLLSESAWLGQWALPAGVQAINLDQLALAAAPVLTPVEPLPESCAYVIHTSGSTGRPKGVLVSHGALANYVQGMLRHLPLAQAQSLAMVSSVAADLGHTTLFGALCAGRTLHLIDADAAMDSQAMGQAMAGVDALKIVPSHLAALLDSAQGAAVLPQRLLVLGGERATTALLERIAVLAPQCQVFNHYGPTETTVGVLAGALDPQAPGLGQPLANSDVRLLDAGLQPVAEGVTGELYIGGAGLARGYVGQPGLTAERFVPDPFGEPGQRLYRSGDGVRRERGRWLYQGRLDDQVKIRGYRVEPGEVAASLRRLAGVREAVVLAQASERGQQLVGYVVGEAGLEVGPLFAQLRGRLPEYLVPAHLLLLEHLPLTANGKLDRRALPQPAATAQRQYNAPQGELETRIAAIWQDLLKVEQVGRQDNFFELGGDSIISIQVVSRAREAGIRLNPKQLFLHQTVQGLAQVAEWREARMAEARGPEQGAMPLLPIQQMFFDTEVVDRHHWNQSVLLSVARPLRPEALEQALQALVLQHDALRLGFTPGAEGWHAEHRPVEATPALLWQRQVADAEAMQGECEVAQRSLDLAQGPLLRAVLFDWADGQQRLLLAAHHLVVDGVSWRILLEDLQHAYSQAVRGEPPRLPARTTSFKHWAERLQTLAAGDALQGQLGYWLQQSLPQDLPTTAPDCVPLQRDAHTVYSRLDAETTRRLLQEAPSAYRTRVQELLLAALARVICQWTGQAGTQVVLEGHGREALFDEVDLSRSVGWFTTKYPLSLTPRPGLGATLKAIKEQVRAVPDNGIGYGVLRYLGDASNRALFAERPLPRITFNYLGQFDNSFAAHQPGQAALFGVAREAAGSERAADAPLGNWLTLNGQVFEGQLSIGWIFSPRMFDPAQVQALATAFSEQLQALVEHCCDQANGGLTPSDVPLARLTQAQLEHVPVPAREVMDIYPLSPMQQGMLFHSLEADEAALYINQTCVPVQGLDIPRFIAAWDQALACHDVLRTRFWHDSTLAEPLQIVCRQAPSLVQVLDWRGREVDDQALHTLAEAECREGFDLQRGALMRVTVVRLDERRCHLIWTRHHILMDGWSSSRLLGEVLQAYHGRPVQAEGRFRDYIEWLQRQGDAKALEAFWRQQLAALEEVTELAAGTWPKPAPGQVGHDALYLEWDAPRTARLRQAAQQLRVTANTLIQGAWVLLLQRFTGQQRVCFGATVAGRPASLPQAGSMLGLFINTLPIVQAPHPEQTVQAWLAQLQANNLEVREHEHASLADIQRWAGQGGRSLFDSIVVFENYPVDERLEEAAEGELRFGSASGRDVTNYAMDLAVNLRQTLSIEFLYLRNRFTEASVANIRACFERLLLGLLEQPQATLGSLAMLEPAAVQAGNGLLPHGQAPSLLACLQAQARRQPDAVAVVCGDQQLTYAELDHQANQLAQALLARGVGAEERIGVALNRSVQTLVAFYAVLKAGAAYVPLDIDYPQERLQWIIDDSAMRILISVSSLRQRLPDGGVERLELDRLDWATLPAQAPALAIDEQQLAYLIYTSGSTGKPKGVAVPRGPLAMHCQAIIGLYGMDTSTRELLFMSFAFDGAQERWLSTLCAGGRLVLRDDTLWTAEQTWAALHAHGISIACFPPAYLKQLAEFAEQHGTPPAVRIYCFGGDAVADESFEQARRSLRPQWLTNGYGPTETVVTPLLWKAAPQDACEAAYAPIGRRVGNRSLYVLDAWLDPVPDGVPGELYIGGEGLARGYHQCPGLSAERFIASPFEAGGRLYRTGDLVRRRADGLFDYLGRLDHQVKIRGFRIELGEIEARLRSLPGVRDALVLARDSQAGKRLVGYVVAATPQVRGEALRDALQQQLPDYMVPAQVVLLDAWPLNPAGKIDRLALPDADFRAKAHVAPRNALERLLTQIWQEVLEVERVGITDNFFELGGDSLRTLKVLSKVRSLAEPPFELKLRDILAKPTIAQLSGYEAHESDLNPLLVLNATAVDAPALFCLHAGFGTVFDYEPLARRLEGHYRVHGLQCRMLLDRDWQDDSLASMAIDYAQYIRQCQPQGPYHLLGWSLGGTLALLVAAQLEMQGQAVAFLGLVDSFIPFAEVPAQDDWRDDLPAFLRQTCGLPVSREHLPQAEPDLEGLGQLFAGLLGERAGEGFAADELARAYQVGLRLKALSRLTPAMPRTRCPASLWWRADLPAALVSGFEQHVQCGIGHERVAVGHYDMLSHEVLLDQVRQCLVRLGQLQH